MPAAARRPKPGRVRKNIEIDQKKLDEVKRHFGAKSETEALDLALDHIVFTQRLRRSLTRLRAAGGIEEVFPDGGLARWREASGLPPES